MRSARSRDLHTPQLRFADQSPQDPIAVQVASPTSTMMIGNPSREELPIVLNITANPTRRSTRMSECTSTISEMHDDVSTNAASVAMKKKYAAARSMSKSTLTRTQLSSRSMPTTLQTMAPTTPKGPRHSRGRFKHFNGPVVSKSLGLSPTRDG